MTLFLHIVFLLIVGAILGVVTTNAVESKKKTLSFYFGSASFILLSTYLTLLVYDINKIFPVKHDISKIEKQLHNYEINNYLSKFCEVIYSTKHADELTIMQTTNKNNEEIWEFCNEKLKNSSVYEEMKTDQNVKKFNKSLMILNAKLKPAFESHNKILYVGCGLTFTPIIILLILTFCSWVSTLRRLDRESREKKIVNFLEKINS